MLLGLTSGILTTVLIAIGILLVVYIIFRLGKFIFGLIVNVALGFISIFVLNALFSIGIPWDWIVIIITALLGLPGVAIIVVLKLLGISL